MTSWVIAVLAAILFFLGCYLSFDYWYEKIWLRMLRTRDETRLAYEEVFVYKTAEAVLQQQLLISGGIAALFFFLLWPVLSVSIPFCLILFWFSWKLPLIYVKQVIRPSRVKKFTVQLIDALTLMANGLKSGLNVPQALQIVVDEMPIPIREEFGLVLNENKIGLTLENAFENLAKRIQTEDISMFVTSVNILRETGGNVSETFETICKTIRDRLKLQSKITAMTAQGMMSAIIVGSMPWGLGIMLYAIDPVSMRPLFVHPVGWAILLVITALEVVGFFVIVKIVKIRV